MISGRDVTIEIGGRTLLRDAAFFVGPDDKVGLVGRNGTGKSSLVSVICGQVPGHVRARGDVSVQGTIGFLPQVPTASGLGLEPTGFSHVLSARGLDVLDEELHLARNAVTADPTTEAIATFADLEERYRAAGGYTIEGEIARLAEGIGLRQDMLFEDIDSLSGGQRRRVDIVRVLFGGPDTLVLDEPTNHLDLAAKRWLTNELSALHGCHARDQPRPQVARPGHHQGPQPGRRQPAGIHGELQRLPHAADRRHRATARRSARSRTARSAG